MTKEQEKFSYIKNYKDYDVVGDDIDFKVFADCGPKEVVLQFEESDSQNDWVNNLLFIPWPVKLGNKTAWTTLGYARAYKSAEDIPVQELLKEIVSHPDFKAVIRGWSFGSCILKSCSCNLNRIKNTSLNHVYILLVVSIKTYSVF